MLKKLCKCGAVIPARKSVCDRCASKYQRTYDRYHRERADFYKDRRWASVRSIVRSQAMDMDLYQLYKYNRLVQGRLAHHIQPLEDAPSLAYDADNLIWLSDASHHEIHALYDSGKKFETMGYLHSIKKNFRGGGLKSFCPFPGDQRPPKFGRKCQ